MLDMTQFGMECDGPIASTNSSFDQLPLSDVATQLKALSLHPHAVTLQRIKASARAVLLATSRTSHGGEAYLAGTEFHPPDDICLGGEIPGYEKRVTFFVSACLCCSHSRQAHCSCCEESHDEVSGWLQ
jgi:hypothetical protein